MSYRSGALTSVAAEPFACDARSDLTRKNRKSMTPLSYRDRCHFALLLAGYTGATGVWYRPWSLANELVATLTLVLCDSMAATGDR
jgi:hypothetical protein